MSFFESIIESLGIEGGGYFRAVMLSDQAVYLENVLSIKSYSDKEITVRLKRGGLTVTGEKMFIKKYCCGDLAICGKIEGITLI